MTEKTSAELQREAEIARARVSDTAESIRNKMTPGQLIDEFSGLLTAGDSGSMFATLKSQVAANPLPVALVGVGLLWLMAGQGAALPQPDGSIKRQSWGSGPVEREPAATGASSPEGGITDALLDAPGQAVSMVGDAVEGITASVSAAAREASGGAARYGSATVEQATKVTTAAADMLSQEPLVLAALGLALGTAVGALLPHTDFEDQQLGQTSENIRDKANELLSQGVDGAKEVAADAYRTLKEEADNKGVSGDSASLVDKVSDVVRNTAAKTERNVRDKLTTTSDSWPT
ncbi:hypothetical protein FJ930_27735 [Mesorhizobium sp. B2-4-15]|uniref:hypothetical protein n=1 Tax=unclassified Mesorhizobium TaxID=325217 RepID=UPI001129D9E0|nr:MULTISPECIES: hypothetical protein [unclassified Mesorhizobium]TPK61517.1 hypothetical protein FJ930_27735 [Mesorhizobium sp. B2-4-15]TPM25321.1 hypothetical protein FJ958_21700 [Mesorhizobium sp. B2-3-5]